MANINHTNEGCFRKQLLNKQFNISALLGQSITDFVSPDLPQKCTWSLNVEPMTNPHDVIKMKPPESIFPNILRAIGNTPLVKLNRIPKAEGIKCEMLAKCEFLNPGGSVKDRIGCKMIEDAEAKGLLKPGSTIIEPSSGNTGISVAMACAIKGYHCVIVMSEKMSDEKVYVLKALGAEIIRTPMSVSFDSPQSYFAVAQKLQKQIPNSTILDQYRNPVNALAHYYSTATEIYDQCEGNIDMIVLGAGTGGTLTGIARYLKEKNPFCAVVGIDSEGSVISESEHLNDSNSRHSEIEGIGHDFVPSVLDRSLVDKWFKVTDMETFNMARRLIKEEGLMIGGSSGAIMCGAIKAAISLKENQRCVVLFPDGMRNYMSKFVSNCWMEGRSFIPSSNIYRFWWWEIKVGALKLPEPTPMLWSSACSVILEKMNKTMYNQIPVIDDDNNFLGIVTMTHLTNLLVSAKLKLEDPVLYAITKQFRKVTLQTTLGVLSKILEQESFAAVVENLTQNNKGYSTSNAEEIIGIVTLHEFVKYITLNDNEKDYETDDTHTYNGFNLEQNNALQ